MEEGLEQQEKLTELVRQAKDGDRSAMEALYRQTYPALWRTVRSMTKNDADALDVLQDSYLRAFTSLAQLRRPARFLPWLKRIAVNELRQQLRKKQPLPFAELPQDASPLPELVSEQTPERLVEQKEQARALQQALDTLPDGQRTVLVLYYCEQYSVREIAQQLGVTQGTVKTQLHHGRKKLEAALQGTLLPALMLLAASSRSAPTPRALPTERLPEAGTLPLRSGTAVLPRVLAAAATLTMVGGAVFGVGAAARYERRERTAEQTESYYMDADLPPQPIQTEEATDPKPALPELPTEPLTELHAETPTEPPEPPTEPTELPTEAPAELPTEQAMQASSKPFPAQTQPLATELTLTEAPTEPEPAVTEVTSGQQTEPEVLPTESPLPPGSGNIYLKQGQFYYTSFTSNYALELFCVSDAGERADDCLRVSAYGTTVELIFDAKRPGSYAVYARVPPCQEVWYYFTAVVS